MGKCTPEDHTSMVTPVTTIVAGLLSMAGGVAAIVLGTQANEDEEGSGNATINAGAAMITAGFVGMTGAITWLAFKCREIAARDDSDDEDEDERGGAQEMNQIAENLGQLEQGLGTEADRVGSLAGPPNDEAGQ
jgi:hypothetical protein